MRLLDRYLLRELLIPLGYCLGGLLMLYLFFDLVAEFNHLQECQLTASDIVLYALVQIPAFLVLVLPIALLLALLYALTNHARHHEITAIRAAGVSLWRICLPYLVIGGLAGLGVFALNELCVPGTSEQSEHILHRRLPHRDASLGQGLIRAAGLANNREGRTWLAGDYNPRTGEMDNTIVTWKQADGVLRWLIAARAVRSHGVWTFFKVQQFEAGAEADSLPTLSAHTDVLALPQFKETPEEILSEIVISKGMSLRNRTRSDVPIAQILNYLRLHPQPPDSIRAWLYTSLHGRLALPWTCVVVVLIALPFGAASGRRNVFVGVASSLVICLVYHFLQKFCLALGAGGHLYPWVAGWCPNFTFGLTGIWLTAKVR